jgi:SAM-dependent methyltransferase
MGVDELALLARQLYVGGPYLMRKLMHYRIRICPFERLLPLVPPGASVLDVGCGAGLFLALLSGVVPELVGVGFDHSGLAIKTAARMAEEVKKAGLSADLTFVRLGTAEPWPSGTFDVVSLVDVLHHVPPAHQKGVFERATKSVKPNGILLYKDMADHPVFQAGMNRLHDLILARQWIHYVPIRRIEEWAGECGLTITHAKEISRFWYRHEVRVFRKPPAPLVRQQSGR